MADDIRALLHGRDPTIPEQDFPKLQAYWDHLNELAEQLDLDAPAAEPAFTYRAEPNPR